MRGGGRERQAGSQAGQHLYTPLSRVIKGMWMFLTVHNAKGKGHSFTSTFLSTKITILDTEPKIASGSFRVLYVSVK